MVVTEENKQQKQLLVGHKDLAHKSLLQSDALYQVRSINKYNFIFFFFFLPQFLNNNIFVN